jgi:hypothetical protein
VAVVPNHWVRFWVELCALNPVPIRSKVVLVELVLTVVGEIDASVGATSFTVSVTLLTEAPQVAVALKLLVLSSSSALPPRMLP